jgi:RimJ/RimL family protein N-acetyltransferase
MKTLRTGRLRLTPVTTQNAGALWRVLQGPDLRDYQDLPNVGEEAFARMVAKRPRQLNAVASGRFEWLIYRSGVRRALGWVSLRIAERQSRSGEIGYSVLGEFRGQGVAQEAVRALITEAFATAKLARVSAYCVPANEPSRRVLKKLGFRDGGIVHHGASVGGRPVDVIHHTMHRQEWDQSKNSMEMPASAYP